jgi:hypothetical protein
VIFMTTKTAETIDLPRPVAAYFAADTTGAEAVARCFTDGAVELHCHFTLEGDKIARLEIAP